MAGRERPRSWSLAVPTDWSAAGRLMKTWYVRNKKQKKDEG
jgi:hypothetical protein